jgi:hypothetical protein
MNFSRFFAIFFVAFAISSAQDAPPPAKGLSIVRSLVLPGWGNYELGNKTAAYWHISAEALIWAGYFYTDNLAEQQSRDYKSFAISSLGLANTSYSNSYYRLISRYNSYDDYIEFQRRQGNAISSDLGEDRRWRWASETERKKFNLKRIEADETKKDLRFWLYGALLNRVAAFFTTRRDYNAAFSLNSSVTYSKAAGNSLALNFNYKF